MKGYIYTIKSSIDGKFYVGSTIDINARKISHFSHLKSNSHHSRHLQNAYNKHGKDNFKFEELLSIDFRDKSELFELEIFYINKYESLSRGNGYNLAMPTLSGGQVSEHLFRGIFELGEDGGIIKRHKSIGELVRSTGVHSRKVFEVASGMINYHNNRKYVYKDEYDESKDYSFKPYSRTGARAGKQVNQYSIDGIYIRTYDKISEAESDNSIKPMMISSVLVGNQKSTGGFIWRYYDGDNSDLNMSIDENKISKRKNTLYQYDLNGNYIATYDKHTLPEEFKLKGVRKCIYGERPTYKGFIWK